MASNNTPIMGTKDTNNNEHPISLPYGVCSTAATTAAKEVSIPGVKSLTSDDVGTMICVKFTNANSADAPTLNVNSLGAKNICQYGTMAANTVAINGGWLPDSIIILIYDGTSWIFNKGFSRSMTWSDIDDIISEDLSLNSNSTNNTITLDLDDGSESVLGTVELKTVNGNSLLGTGDITVSGGSGGANISKIWTGTCSSSAASDVKTVILDDSTDFPSTLTAGTRIAVTFQYTNTIKSPTLAIQSASGTTFSANIYIAYINYSAGVSTGGATTAYYGKWAPYETVLFTYNGTYWIYSTGVSAAYGGYYGYCGYTYRGYTSSATTTGTTAIPLLAKTTGTNSSSVYSNSNVYIQQGTATANTTDVSLYTPSVTLSADPTSDMQATTKQYVDNLLSKLGMWATAYAPQDLTLGNSSTATTGCIVFESISGNTGDETSMDGFFLSDGGIECPFDGRVEISAAVNLGTEFTANDLVHLRITKNGTHIMHDVILRMHTTTYGTIQIQGFSSVNAGDIIKARVYNQTAARGTILTSSSSRLNIAYIGIV